MPGALTADIGRRLVAVEIDAIAKNDPERAWAAVPVDDNDLAKGHKSVTYKQFSNAISCAARWISERLSGERPAFETLVYAGPNDLRYAIIAVAALKCGKKLLLCSTLASPAAQRHLLEATSCTTYLHAASLASMVKSVVGAERAISLLEVPELNEWLYASELPVFPYNKTWDDAQSDPWLIFHSSGTTGMPKPIVYTNWMMTSFDAAELMPDADRETMNTLFRNQRYYVSVPPLHFIGMTAALQWTVFLGMVNVQNASGPPTPARVLEILHHGKVEGVVMPPSLIEGIVQDPQGLEALRRLNCIYFGGAPVAEDVAEKLVGHCKLFPAMGSTEAGAYFIEVRNDSDDWAYYRFRPSMGVELQKRTDTLYELVFIRRPALERWQQLFKVYPDLQVFPTKDLWSPHPSKPNLWKYGGRADDLFKLSSGHGLHVTNMEAIIQKHPEIKTAIIGGERRPFPFAIIELSDRSSPSSKDGSSIIAEIWPAIEEANETCTDHVKLKDNLILFATPAKPLPLTAKDTVLRPAAISLYQIEIDEMYKNSGYVV